MINTLKPNIYDTNVLECYPVSRIRCLEDTAKPIEKCELAQCVTDNNWKGIAVSSR